MSASEISEQLVIFSSSFVSILELQQSLTANSSNSSAQESLCSLNDTRDEIVNTIIQLNLALFSYSNNVNSNDLITPGIIVLAPRFVEGSFCYDFAIITQIKDLILDSQAFASQEEHEKHVSSDQSDTYNENKQQTIFISWLRPRSQYEVISSKISFTSAQIQLNAMELWFQQEKQLTDMKSTDSILFLSPNDNNGLKGIWKKGKIIEVNKNEKTIKVEEIKRRQNDKLDYFLLNKNINFIAPLVEISNDKVKQHKIIDLTGEKRKRPTDDDIYDTSDEENEIISIPSYYQQKKNKAIGNNFNFIGDNEGFGASSHDVVGLWERHTKGIGGKLLSKMGFIRGCGKGLGKYGQGIAAPIEGLDKPLPQGLGLDFIFDQTKTGKEAAIRRDIVAQFNQKFAKSRNAAQKNKEKQMDNSNMFDFLNKVDGQVNSLNKDLSKNNSNKIREKKKAVPMSSSKINKIF